MTEIAFMGKMLTGLVDITDDRWIEQGRFAAYRRKEGRIETYIKDMHLADPFRIFGQQERRFPDLEAEGMRCTENGIAPGAAADEQTAGDIDRYPLVAKPVEMIHQPGSHALQCPVQTRAQQRIDKHLAVRRILKMLIALDESHFHGSLMQTGQVDLKIFGTDVAEFQNMNRYRTILC